MVNNNLSSLIIAGFPTTEQLHNAWASIVQQYTDAVGNNEYNLYTNLCKEISIKRLTYNAINNAVDILRKQYHSQIANELNKALGTTFKFKFSDEERYSKELDRCINRAKSLKISIDLLQIKIEGLETKFSKVNTKPTYEYYQSALITLSDYTKYQISDSITVFEFCERLKRFNNYYEQMKKVKK
jgi:hypothetical protein